MLSGALAFVTNDHYGPVIHPDAITEQFDLFGRQTHVVNPVADRAEESLPAIDKNVRELRLDVFAELVEIDRIEIADKSDGSQVFELVPVVLTAFWPALFKVFCLHAIRSLHGGP